MKQQGDSNSWQFGSLLSLKRTRHSMEPGFYAHLSVSGPRVLILKPTSRSHPLSLICESVDGGMRASLRFQDSGTLDPELFGRLLPVPVYGLVGTVQFDKGVLACYAMLEGRVSLERKENLRLLGDDT